MNLNYQCISIILRCQIAYLNSTIIKIIKIIKIIYPIDKTRRERFLAASNNIVQAAQIN
jgi:hypothetical protein